jgi:hypothetical protein
LSDVKYKAMVEDWGCAAANALDAKNLTAQASEMRRYIETLYDEVVETGGAPQLPRFRMGSRRW